MFLADTTSATSWNAGVASAGGLQRKERKRKNVNFSARRKEKHRALVDSSQWLEE